MDHEDSHYSLRKKTHFAENHRDYSADYKSRRPMRECSENKGSNRPHCFTSLTEDKKKIADKRYHWRDLKACVNCGSIEHWAAKCN